LKTVQIVCTSLVAAAPSNLAREGIDGEIILRGRMASSRTLFSGDLLGSAFIFSVPSLVPQSALVYNICSSLNLFSRYFSIVLALSDFF
jgi:hypothetical protein